MIYVIDLEKLNTMSVGNETKEVTFTNITNLHGFADNFPSSFPNIQIGIYCASGIAYIRLKNSNNVNYTYTVSSLVSSTNVKYYDKCLSFVTDDTPVGDYDFFRPNLVISTNLVKLYSLNEERDVVSKKPTLINSIEGSFKNIVSLRTPVLDIEGMDILNTFNYIYIAILRRYYYVQSVELVSKNIVRINLLEDVLMSFSDLIYKQSAFVTRNENEYDLDIMDDNVGYDYDKYVGYYEITPTTEIFPNKQTKTGDTYDKFAEDDRKNIVVITVIG